jgi:hypothetical protein
MLADIVFRIGHGCPPAICGGMSLATESTVSLQLISGQRAINLVSNRSPVHAKDVGRGAVVAFPPVNERVVMADQILRGQGTGFHLVEETSERSIPATYQRLIVTVDQEVPHTLFEFTEIARPAIVWRKPLANQ